MSDDGRNDGARGGNTSSTDSRTGRTWGSIGPTRPDARICFVVLPYNEDTRLVDSVIRPIAHQHNYYVRTTRDYPSKGVVEPPVINDLASADLVVADMRDCDPVVFYQIAIRHGTRLPIIHIVEHNAIHTLKISLAGMNPIELDIADSTSCSRAGEALGIRLYDLDRGGSGTDDTPLLHMGIPFSVSPSEYTFGARRLSAPRSPSIQNSAEADRTKAQLNDLELMTRRSIEMLQSIEKRLRVLEGRKPVVQQRFGFSPNL